MGEYSYQLMLHPLTNPFSIQCCRWRDRGDVIKRIATRPKGGKALKKQMERKTGFENNRPLGKQDCRA